MITYINVHSKSDGYTASSISISISSSFLNPSVSRQMFLTRTDTLQIGTHKPVHLVHGPGHRTYCILTVTNATTPTMEHCTKRCVKL